MKVIMIAQYIGDISNTKINNGRFVYLANRISQKHDLEIISTNYYHQKKSYFSKTDDKAPYKITLLNEPGYKKNISIKRLISHKVLAKNILKYLKSIEKPDLVYLAIPSLSGGNVVTQYCSKNNIKLILDVQDLWPEAFKMVFNIPVISNLIFYPMEKQSKYIYSNCDYLISVSNTYLKIIESKTHKKKMNYYAYLGTEKSTFDKYSSNIKLDPDKLHIVYIGTLGASYDLGLVFESMNSLDLEMKNKMDFIIIGDGPERQLFEKKASGLPVHFFGLLNYEEMVGILKQCDIAVNPIRKGSAGSIINKVGDYAMAGLPVINTQECIEYRNLVNEYEFGINCDNVFEFTSALEMLINDDSKRKKYGDNSRRCGIDKFDRNNTYGKIVDIIDSLL